MILFPNAKINLGLRIFDKRLDGYHNIETLMYPVPFCCDVIEFAEHDEFQIKEYGRHIPHSAGNNLLVKVYKQLIRQYSLPLLSIHLLKNIPVGAGLGGGSADAVFFLKTLNTQYNLCISSKKLMDIALGLGSDCPFFISNQPAIIRGRGGLLQTVEHFLSGYHLVVVDAGVSISTAEAYTHLKNVNNSMDVSLQEIIGMPPDSWKNYLYNDFESFVFGHYPKLASLKKQLYDKGAFFASLTGSGSVVYGLFAEKQKLPLSESFENAVAWTGRLK